MLSPLLRPGRFVMQVLEESSVPPSSTTV
jgi:hypothetical protein